ncbi:hypothetical protein ACLOJK_018857, partial [Asimina triloba]
HCRSTNIRCSTLSKKLPPNPPSARLRSTDRSRPLSTAGEIQMAMTHSIDGGRQLVDGGHHPTSYSPVRSGVTTCTNHRPPLARCAPSTSSTPIWKSTIGSATKPPVQTPSMIQAAPTQRRRRNLQTGAWWPSSSVRMWQQGDASHISHPVARIVAVVHRSTTSPSLGDPQI